MPPALPDSLVGRVRGPVRADVTKTGHKDSPKVKAQVRKNQSPDQTARALETLLADLGPQIKRAPFLSTYKSSFSSSGSSPSASRSLSPLPGGSEPGGPTAGEAEEEVDRARFCATGIEALDRCLGGGFPRGRLSEICGPPSSGRTALALSLLATALAEGGLTGWIDFSDAFDPISAEESGIDLERLLWVRPRSEKEALQSCDRLLQTEGFELVIFDCVKTPILRDVAWLRLARLVARTRTALVTLSETKVSARPELVLEMHPRGPRFTPSPSLFDSLETAAVVVRHRSRPVGSETLLRLEDPPP